MKKILLILMIFSFAAGKAQVTPFSRKTDTVVVKNFPAVQSVSGSFSVTPDSTKERLKHLVDVNNWPAVQTVTGSLSIVPDSTKERLLHLVNVNNWPTTQPVSISGAVPVTGTFWQATQPVSGTVGISGSVPVTGTFWQVTQPVSGTVGISGSVPVTGTFWQATQPVSASSLPLPTGASTAAKQPALGTAGTASADVITVQGITGMTAVKVDGSAVTQPVSGTVTVNAGTNLNTSSLALESGGNLASIVTNTANIDAALPATLGQTTMAKSLPVTIASNQSAIQVSPTTIFTIADRDTTITGQGSQSASGNNILLSTAGTSAIDAIGSNQSYRSFFCQIIASSGISSGQIIFEGSNNNTNFVALTFYDDAVITGQPLNSALSVAASTFRYFSGKITYRYIRCRISTVFAGGTVQAICRYSTKDYTPRVTTVTQPTTANLQTTATQTGTWTVQPGNTANTTAWLFEQRTGTTNGSTTSTVNSAATNNATNLKASAGMIYMISAMNASASTKYVRIFNKATAPTGGTDVPVMVIAIPATSSKEVVINTGLKMATGIGYMITGGAPATDNTSVAAGDVQLLINWQ